MKMDLKQLRINCGKKINGMKTKTITCVDKTSGNVGKCQSNCDVGVFVTELRAALNSVTVFGVKDLRKRSFFRLGCLKELFKAPTVCCLPETLV